MDEQPRMRPQRPPQQLVQHPGVRPQSAIPRGRAMSVPQPPPPMVEPSVPDSELGYLALIHEECEKTTDVSIAILRELQALNAFLRAAATEPTAPAAVPPAVSAAPAT